MESHDFSTMAILGQGSAILYGTIAPSNTDVLWAKTSTNDPQTWAIVGFYEYVSGAWEPVSGVVESATAPSDITKIWKKPNGNTFSLLVYDTANTVWVNLFDIPANILSGDITIADASYNGKVISNQSVNDYTVTIEPAIPVDSLFIAERAGTGRLIVNTPAGSEINGIDGHAVEILNQYTSISIRCYAIGKFIIEGNTI